MWRVDVDRGAANAPAEATHTFIRAVKNWYAVASRQERRLLQQHLHLDAHQS